MRRGTTFRIVGTMGAKVETPVGAATCRPLRIEYNPCGRMVPRNVAAMIHRHKTLQIHPVRLNGTTHQRVCRGGNLPPATLRIQPVRLNGTTYRHVIPTE